jgi:hypothetical protein
VSTGAVEAQRRAPAQRVLERMDALMSETGDEDRPDAYKPLAAPA